jgi:hypothetical protein
MVENNAIVSARSLYKEGKRQEARNLLANAIISDTNNENLWFGLSYCLEDQEQIIYCLRRVLQIKPDHKKAITELSKLENPSTKVKETTDKSPKPEQKDEPIGNPKSIQTNPDKARPTNHIASLNTPGVTQKSDDYFLNVTVKGEAGESASETGKKLRRKGLIIGTIVGIFLFAVAIFFIYSAFFRVNLIIALVLLILALTSLKWGSWLWDPIFDKMDDYRQGARAEVKVGDCLKSLGANFVVINDIQTGHGNIDHAVLSKTGQVFVIETKSHFGRLEISREELFLNKHLPEKDFIKQVLGNSFWIRDKIQELKITKIWVTPILVFTNLWVPENPPIKGVYIENIKFLNKRIMDISKINRKNDLWENRQRIIEAVGK